MLCAGTDLYCKTKADFCFLILVSLTEEPASQNRTAVFKIQYTTAKFYILNFTYRFFIPP